MSINITTTLTSISTSTDGSLDDPHICMDLHSNGISNIFWLIATVFCFLAFISTIYTVFRAYQLWALIDELENLIIELVDETLQILLPIEICKLICHPNIGAANFNMNVTTPLEMKRKKENRYPEDVTYPPSDIEGMYDFFGDEDLRVSKTMQLSVVGVVNEHGSKESDHKITSITDTPAKKGVVTNTKTPTSFKQAAKKSDKTAQSPKKEGSNKNESKSPATAIVKAKSEKNVPLKAVKSTPAAAINELYGGDLKRKTSQPALAVKKSDVDPEPAAKASGKELKTDETLQ